MTLGTSYLFTSLCTCSIPIYFRNSAALIPTRSLSALSVDLDADQRLGHPSQRAPHPDSHSELNKQLEKDDIGCIVEGVRDLIHEIVASRLNLF